MMRSLSVIAFIFVVAVAGHSYAEDCVQNSTSGDWYMLTGTPVYVSTSNCRTDQPADYFSGAGTGIRYYFYVAGDDTNCADGHTRYDSYYYPYSEMTESDEETCNAGEPDTCQNGAWDGDETGWDCGGSCDADCQDSCPSPTELVDTTGSEACDILTASGLSCEMCFELTSQVNGECDNASWPTDSGECAIIGSMTSPFPANPDSDGFDESDHSQPSQDPTETTDFGSDTTYDYSTTDNGDGSTTATETKTSTTTREDGVTKQETVTTSTTTNSDGSTTVIVTTQTNYSGGGGGSTTTSSTTTNYDSDGNVSGISTTGSGTATSSDYSPEDAELPTVNVNLDTSGIETRIDQTNSFLDDLLEFFTFSESDKDTMLSDFDQGTSDLLDEAETEQQEFVDGIIEDTDFDTLPFEEDLTSEIEGLIPDPGVCTDIEIPFSFNSEYINLDYTFVIECEPFETYFKPVITWFFYGVTAIMAFYSFTAPVGEGK